MLMEASLVLPHHDQQQDCRLLVFVLAVKILGEDGEHKHKKPPPPLHVLLLVMFAREAFFRMMVRILITLLFLLLMMKTNKRNKKKKMSSKWVPFVFCSTTIAITGAS
jgi:hypothetical protein